MLTGLARDGCGEVSSCLPHFHCCHCPHSQTLQELALEAFCLRGAGHPGSRDVRSIDIDLQNRPVTRSHPYTNQVRSCTNVAKILRFSSSGFRATRAPSGPKLCGAVRLNIESSTSAIHCEKAIAVLKTSTTHSTTSGSLVSDTLDACASINRTCLGCCCSSSSSRQGVITQQQYAFFKD